MNSFRNKVKRALEKSQTLDDIEFILEQIETHRERPNYRTKAGREERDELEKLCRERINELHLTPF